ncbi:MAG: NAD-dependent epimerase/dehydratase family protein [Candidatus Cloacimonadaceae bacterium]|jgi:nucleoside-diphosphate-sugar epimerase|nr:NAD-dependent epimerase/dehydratase family protein [Candidatus Cloacimonadaceae bacterium]
MKIAITGANGFVGSALLKHFAANDHQAIALIRPSAQKPITNQELRIVDYDDRQSLLKALSGVDVLVHNAGKTKTLQHQEMLTANLGLTRNVLDAVNSLPTPIHLIYISSQAASRPSNINEPVSEDEVPQPITSYGKSKAWAERLIREECQQAYTIVRPCSIYGPGDRDFLQLFKLCRFGLGMQIGAKERQVNMIHVQQLADFLLLVAANPKAYQQVFFATDNQVYTQAYIAASICKVMGKHHRQIIVPETVARQVFGISDMMARLRGKAATLNLEKLAEILAEAWLANPEKARQVLAWDPAPRLEELIMETYQWYVQESWL